MRHVVFALSVVLLVAACSSVGAARGSDAPGSLPPVTSAQPAPIAPTAGASTESPSAAPTREPIPTPGPGLARLEPDDGAYFGLNLDWGTETALEATQRLGRTPAVWVQFARFPLDAGSRGNLDSFVEQVADVGGLALITLEPHDGLAAVTDDAAIELADLLASYWTDYGVRSFVRFAHEMNGSWYPWAQQPTAYVAAFRRVAKAVHERSPGSAMIAADPRSAAGRIFDTDGDGSITKADDPYAPYYPGDTAVDWIGVSLYHWGREYPWGENEVPEPGAFEALIRGTVTGSHKDGVEIPDLYAVYAEGH